MEWESFVRSIPESPFLQSWAWGDFQQSAGRRVIRLGVRNNNNLVACAQCIIRTHQLGIMSFSVFRGPIISGALPVQEYSAAIDMLLQEIQTAARANGATYIHLEPPLSPSSASSGVFTMKVASWRRVSNEQPSYSLVLDLSQSESELLAAMHQKTRYNINLAERKSVHVSQSNDPASISQFLTLNHVMSSRQKITPHADAYYKRMMESLGPAGVLSVFTALHETKTLAANLMVRFGDTVTYLHGASGNEHREFMAPHLLQWKQMQWAKAQGARWYDFWGIAPADADPTHPWSGITRFKRGFGGEDREYMPALELPLKALKYRIISMRRRLR